MGELTIPLTESKALAIAVQSRNAWKQAALALKAYMNENQKDNSDEFTHRRLWVKTLTAWEELLRLGEVQARPPAPEPVAPQ